MMQAATAATTTPAGAGHKSSFFRQSGWMMITAVAGGACMFLLQLAVVKLLGKDEYSVFATLLQVANWMNIPALGLQMVFAQQTAAATTEHQWHQLAGTCRAVLKWTFGIWVVMALITAIYHQECIAALKISNPVALWLTVVVGLTMLWQPIFQGLMQGRQNFLWFGWAAIINGVGRVVVGIMIVYVLKGRAAGLMAGVLIGLVGSLGAGIFQNADVLKEKTEPFDAGGWLKRVVPLTLGFGVSTFIFSADAIVVQNFFGNSEGATRPYMFLGTLCRAIVLFTSPVAAVMFPKLVKNRATASKGNLLGMVLLVTGGLSVVAVGGLMVVSGLLLSFFLKGDASVAVPLLPWFAAGMVPLAMGNVVLNNLMAHSRFKVVPALVVLAVGYWVALQYFHSSFLSVVQTFDVFSLIFLGICCLFNWVVQPEKD